MKIIDAGHCYDLERLDVEDGPRYSRLTFVKREGDNFPFNDGHYTGTNCQEVLRALIDRTKYLNNQKPCMETEAALGCLEAALALYEVRAARRHGRHIDMTTTSQLVSANTCNKCKHIGCTGGCDGKT